MFSFVSFNTVAICNDVASPYPLRGWKAEGGRARLRHPSRALRSGAALAQHLRKLPGMEPASVGRWGRSLTQMERLCPDYMRPVCRTGTRPGHQPHACASVPFPMVGAISVRATGFRRPRTAGLPDGYRFEGKTLNSRG